LAANTAKGNFDLVTAQEQLDLAVETRDSFQRNARIIERNYKAGDDTTSALDVQFSRNNVASAERDLVGRNLSRDNSARALEVLLGRYPSGAMRTGKELPTLKSSVPAGLPSDLLMRRPDIVAAAAAVEASAKRANAARKDLLPSFRLTAGGSTSSPELGEMLIDPEKIVWNAATSIAQPVFEGGSLRAQARRALAQNEESIRSFAATVLRALREVESALAAERSLAQQEAFLAVELRQANLAEKQALRDYSEGIVQILSVLEAQRRAVAARNSMIALRNQRLQNRVDLHLALGGDFKTEGAEG
jgi:outer membrane protein TolC